jgi:hypothetical protein
VKFTRTDLWRAPAVIVLSMLGSYVCALAFIAVLQWSLPPTDGAYRQGLAATLDDPFVRVTAIGWANASGVLVSVVAFFALRGRNLRACFAIALVCVLTEIAVVTPFSGGYAFLGTFPALAVALIWCRRSKARILQIRST